METFVFVGDSFLAFDCNLLMSCCVLPVDPVVSQDVTN